MTRRKILYIVSCTWNAVIDAGTFIYRASAIVSYPAGPQPQMSIPPTTQPYPVSVLSCALSQSFSPVHSPFFSAYSTGVSFDRDRFISRPATLWSLISFICASRHSSPSRFSLSHGTSALCHFIILFKCWNQNAQSAFLVIYSVQKIKFYCANN